MADNLERVLCASLEDARFEHHKLLNEVSSSPHHCGGSLHDCSLLCVS